MTIQPNDQIADIYGKLADISEQLSISGAGVWQLPSYSFAPDATTVTFGTGVFVLHSEPDGSDAPKKYTVPGGTFKVADNTSTWFYIDYNNGVPAIKQTTSWIIFSYTQAFPFYLIIRYDTDTTVFDAEGTAKAITTKIIRRESGTSRFRIERGGLMIGELPTRVITCTEGYIWAMFERNHVLAARSDVDTCYAWYHVGGEWKRFLVDTYNNFYYDDGIDRKQLSSRKYGVSWVFRRSSNNSSDIAYVYGTDNYNLEQAKNSALPSTPNQLSGFTLIGRIICKKGDSSATQIDSVFGITFPVSPIKDHTDLANLQGGAVGEYFHLTKEQYDVVKSLLDTGRTSVSVVAVPSSSDSPGTVGDFAIDSEYFYVCASPNKWSRCPLSSW